MSSSGPFIMFIHGLESNSSGRKANLLKRIFGDQILIPDFPKSRCKRLEICEKIILPTDHQWILFGSSWGGLTATLFALKHQDKVKMLILFAPALLRSLLFPYRLHPITTIPVVLYHGKNDTVVPVDKVRVLAEKIFPTMEYHLVDDDHRLNGIVPTIDWKQVVTK